MIRTLCAVLVLAAVVLLAHVPQAAANPRYASLVMDADTGVILSERYADKALHPASLTKTMTLLMVFEALETGRLRLQDRIVMSRHAASMVPSKLGLAPGQTISVEDAIYALVTKSANDVAAALAEKLGNTESQFAVMMTRKAREIGMTRTTFRNASGLHHPQQVSTARDMAKMGRYLIKRYPQYYHYFSTNNFSYRGHNYRNHNGLMRTYTGMDGIKTGYVGASGFNLLASAVRDNRRLVGVVFGGRSAASRNNHMADLLDRGFSKLAAEPLIASAPIPGRKPDSITRLAAALNEPETAAQDNPRWASLNPMMQSAAFRNLIGEGDSDPAVTQRLETGLRAIAAVREQNNEHADGVQIASLAPARNLSAADEKPWAIQIGAFESRTRTDAALRSAMTALPQHLAHGAPFIAPLKTGNGWLFRARLGGYSKEQAMQACRLLKECLPVAPQAF